MSIPEDSQDHLPGVIAACTILSLAFIVGIPGNVFVVWTICSRMKQRSTTVVLILNLAIADLLVLGTLPIWIYSFAHTWLFGIIACKFFTFLVYCSMYASIFLIMALSLERFTAVFYPFAALRWKKKKTTYAGVLTIWLLSIAFGAVIIPFRGSVDEDAGLECMSYSYTSSSQMTACLLLETLVGFVIPFAIISTCYVCIGKRIGRMTCPTKRRSARLISSVVTAFAFCWLPHHIFNVISIVSNLMENSYPERARELEDISDMGVYIAGAVAFLSSCINPLLYAFAARNFQSSIRLAKLSKLFEQMAPSVRQDARKEASSWNGKEETLTSMEVI